MEPFLEAGDKIIDVSDKSYMDSIFTRDPGEVLWSPRLAEKPSGLWDDKILPWEDFTTYSRPRHMSVWSEVSAEEEEPDMSWNKTVEYNGDDRSEQLSVTCKNSDDLSQNKILDTIAVIKHKLMAKCAPYIITRIECKMTPVVKNNLVNASKRLRMYGKELPVIPSFDIFGEYLGDEIQIDTVHGAIIKIVDPTKYGETFFKLEGIYRAKKEIDDFI